VRFGFTAVCAVFALTTLAGMSTGCTGGSGPAEGELAPDFVLPRLDGTVQKLSNYRGNVVLVNLWATWCPPCIEEMPLLDQIAREYGPRGLVILGIAGDEDREAVERFVQAQSPAFHILLDPGGAVGTQYGITGYPETFLVDRAGRFRGKFVGPLPEVDGRPGSQVTDALEEVCGG
jgi:cytochrome c biogenesis protein CcmG/thiol:disulfide interchange protein DsbE